MFMKLFLVDSHAMSSNCHSSKTPKDPTKILGTRSRATLCWDDSTTVGTTPKVVCQSPLRPLNNLPLFSMTPVVRWRTGDCTGEELSLFWWIMNSKYVIQWLTHRRCLANMCWLNECLSYLWWLAHFYNWWIWSHQMADIYITCIWYTHTMVDKVSWPIVLELSIMLILRWVEMGSVEWFLKEVFLRNLQHFILKTLRVCSLSEN